MPKLALTIVRESIHQIVGNIERYSDVNAVWKLYQCLPSATRDDLRYMQERLGSNIGTTVGYILEDALNESTKQPIDVLTVFNNFKKGVEQFQDMRLVPHLLIYAQHPDVKYVDAKRLLMWLEISATAGNAASQRILGSFCEQGKMGVPQDKHAALKWYTSAALQGNMLAQFQLGHFLMQAPGNGQDLKMAIQCYTSAAEQGCADAQYALGKCYLEGKGVIKDTRRGMALCEKAAQQEQMDAQRFMGLYYEEQNNLQQAIEWFTRAAQQGDAKAQCYLGQSLLELNDEKKYGEAREWLHKSLAQKHAPAAYTLALYTLGGQCGIPKDEKKGIEYLSKFFAYEDSHSEDIKACLQIFAESYTQGGLTLPQDRQCAAICANLPASPSVKQAKIFEDPWDTFKVRFYGAHTSEEINALYTEEPQKLISLYKQLQPQLLNKLFHVHFEWLKFKKTLALELSQMYFELMFKDTIEIIKNNPLTVGLRHINQLGLKPLERTELLGNICRNLINLNEPGRRQQIKEYLFEYYHRNCQTLKQPDDVGGLFLLYFQKGISPARADNIRNLVPYILDYFKDKPLQSEIAKKYCDSALCIVYPELERLKESNNLLADDARNMAMVYYRKGLTREEVITCCKPLRAAQRRTTLPLPPTVSAYPIMRKRVAEQTVAQIEAARKRIKNIP